MVLFCSVEMLCTAGCVLLPLVARVASVAFACHLTVRGVVLALVLVLVCLLRGKLLLLLHLGAQDWCTNPPGP